MSGSVPPTDEIPALFDTFCSRKFKMADGTGSRLVTGRDINVMSSVTIHWYGHRPTLENSIRYKSEVETVPQTGSTINISTETDIEAISVAIPVLFFFLGGAMFCVCITRISVSVANLLVLPVWVLFLLPVCI